MKKLLLCFCFLVLSIQLSKAQTPLQGTSLVRSSDVTFGVKLALTMTNIKGDGFISSGPIPGIQIGAAMETPIRGDFHFAPEVLYSLQGTRGNGDNIRLHYANFPLMAKYYITDAVSIEIGPQVGVLVADNLNEFLFNGATIDIGLGLGGGYKINDNIHLQLRFNAGLINVIENVEATNFALQLGTVYYFL